MGARYGKRVAQIIDSAEIDHLLDYGCGSKLSLTKTLKPERSFKYQCYDPMVEKYSALPVPAQMVACIDVIEHIELDHLDGVLDHLEDLTEQILFISVHTGLAGKVLSDGRNAHLVQQPMEWWLPKISDRFTIQSVQTVSKVQFYVIAYQKDVELPDDSG